MNTQDATREIWDVIIVGTGVGGATLGHALACKGLRVLFCEKGWSDFDSEHALKGAYAEQFLPYASAPYGQNMPVLAGAGRCWEEIADRSHLFPHHFVPFTGLGTGGSSALFGMAMERFFPCDFSPLAQFPGHVDTTLTETWPISYSDLLPYYEEAEALYRVRGTADSLRPDNPPQIFPAPPPLTPGAEALFKHLESKGLHPYRLPAACEYVPGCECCQGYLCAKNCKNHSGRICLEPAILLHGAALLDKCEVLSLEADRTRVTGIICQRDGQKVKLHAKTVVLAAGALVSPTILLRSTSLDWPDGLANNSGLVGKNLMRHYIDLYLLDLQIPNLDNRFKELAFNDYYQIEGEKLGTLQSFGRLPPAPVMARSLRDEAVLPALGKLLSLVAPLATGFMAKLVERSTVMASIVEDPPYADNGLIRASNGEFHLHYRVHQQDERRIAVMRRLTKQALAPYLTKLVKQAGNNHRIAHVCGTCRFGTDPKQSVLDVHNRAHDVENLYVVDGSYFPSSGGTNPALTIAANALRVANHLVSIEA